VAVLAVAVLAVAVLAWTLWSKTKRLLRSVREIGKGDQCLLVDLTNDGIHFPIPQATALLHIANRRSNGWALLDISIERRLAM
jgi:DNA-binding PucR family transcriptional regulator